MEKESCIFVNLSVDEALNVIEQSDLGVSFSIIKKEEIVFSEQQKCIFVIGEKYFYLVNGYISVTVVIENSEKNTRVHICTSGGGEGLIGYERGREKKFRMEVEEIFKSYII